MNEPRLDREMVGGWVRARSLARGLATPVEDRGGYRVDTGSDSEVCRWVFDRAAPGIAEVGRSEAKPGRLIKLCGTTAELRASLPETWQVEATGWFMARSASEAAAPRLPDGFDAAVTRSGPVARAEIHAPGGVIAACGFAAETGAAFIYDRIVTVKGYRRKGLGTALMVLLGAEKRAADIPDLLVATEAGRALYATLGWQALSPYSTASVAQ